MLRARRKRAREVEEIPPTRQAPACPEEKREEGSEEQRGLTHIAKAFIAEKNRRKEEMSDSELLAEHNQSGHWYCLGCRKWADQQHRESKGHVRTKQWFFSMTRIQRVIEQNRMWKEAETALKKKMKQSKESNKDVEHHDADNAEQPSSSSILLQ